MFATQEAHAQDPHFAQFYNAPIYQNPALTGVFEGGYRVTANYREEYGSVINSNPFRTMAASFDMKHKIGRGDYLNWGVHLMHDEAAGSLATDFGQVSFSYMKQLSGSRYRRNDQYLVAGASAGFGQQSANFDRLWFSSQYDDPNARIVSANPNGEDFGTLTKLYPNVNAGLMWYALFDDNKSIYLGGSLHHVNAPKVSFVTGGNGGEIPFKYVVQAGGEVPFNRDLSLLPAVLVMSQGPQFQSIFGANFRYTNRDWREVAVRIGAWGHLAKDVDAAFASPNLIFAAILEMNRVLVGVSYDVGMGQLANPTNARSAYELSIIYTGPSKYRVKTVCPKF